MFDEILKNIEKRLKNNEEFVLTEIVESEGQTPRGVGAFMFVDKDMKAYGTIGGGISEFESIKYAHKLLLDKKNDIKIFNMKLDASDTPDMVCGGVNKIQFTYIKNDDDSFRLLNNLKIKVKRPMLYIFGGGHIAKELAKIMYYVGFDYIVWDDREEFATADRFPNAKQIIVKSFEEINEVVNITNDDYVVILTHGHIGDYVVEKEVLRKLPYYIGCIGSSTKNQVVNQKLKVSGFSDKDLAMINAPIGIQIGAETPEEIAISIAAELIMYRAKAEDRKKYIEKSTLFDINKKYGERPKKLS